MEEVVLGCLHALMWTYVVLCCCSRRSRGVRYIFGSRLVHGADAADVFSPPFRRLDCFFLWLLLGFSPWIPKEW